MSCDPKRDNVQITEERLSTVGENWLQECTKCHTPRVVTEEVDAVAGDGSRWDFSSLEGNDQMFERYDSEGNCQ